MFTIYIYIYTRQHCRLNRIYYSIIEINVAVYLFDVYDYDEIYVHKYMLHCGWNISLMHFNFAGRASEHNMTERGRYPMCICLNIDTDMCMLTLIFSYMQLYSFNLALCAIYGIQTA